MKAVGGRGASTTRASVPPMDIERVFTPLFLFAAVTVFPFVLLRLALVTSCKKGYVSHSIVVEWGFDRAKFLSPKLLSITSKIFSQTNSSCS